MTVGERIKSIRESLQMTQEQLGHLCGTTKQTIFKYENNIVTNIPLDKLEKIADTLSVSPAYLIGWDDQKEKPAHVVDELSGEETDFILWYRTQASEKEKAVIKAIINS